MRLTFRGKDNGVANIEESEMENGFPLYFNRGLSFWLTLFLHHFTDLIG